MATREEYIDKLEAQLKEWNSKIDALQAKADAESKELKQRFNKKNAELQEKRKALRGKLNKIKNSGDDTFDKVKEDAELLWRDVKDGFAEIKSIVQKK